MKENAKPLRLRMGCTVLRVLQDKGKELSLENGNVSDFRLVVVIAC